MRRVRDLLVRCERSGRRCVVIMEQNVDSPNAKEVISVSMTDNVDETWIENAMRLYAASARMYLNDDIEDDTDDADEEHGEDSEE